MKYFFLLALLCVNAQAKDLVVFAASSLTDVLSKVVPAFEKEHKLKIKFNFDASSRLAFQIEQGAQADLFFSADKEWNNALTKKGHLQAKNSRDLLSNDLVVITHQKHSFKVTDLKALAALKVKHLALAQENVPAGKYALESLKKTGVYDQLKSSIVSADNVRNTLAWIIKDEADLGIVFSTDAKSAKEVKVLYAIPSELHSPVVYPLSIVGKKPDPSAQKFYQYLQSEQVRKEYADFGFKVLK